MSTLDRIQMVTVVTLGLPLYSWQVYIATAAMAVDAVVDIAIHAS